METINEDNKIINVSYNFAKTIFNNINNDIYKKLMFTTDSIYSSSKIKGSLKRNKSKKVKKNIKKVKHKKDRTKVKKRKSR